MPVILLKMDLRFLREPTVPYLEGELVVEEATEAAESAPLADGKVCCVSVRGVTDVDVGCSVLVVVSGTGAETGSETGVVSASGTVVSAGGAVTGVCVDGSSVSAEVSAAGDGLVSSEFTGTMAIGTSGASGAAVTVGSAEASITIPFTGPPLTGSGFGGEV